MASGEDKEIGFIKSSSPITIPPFNSLKFEKDESFDKFTNRLEKCGLLDYLVKFLSNLKLNSADNEDDDDLQNPLDMLLTNNVKHRMMAETLAEKDKVKLFIDLLIDALKIVTN
jgi:hypothetical protein